MSKLADFLRSPHIQLALATGVSIIAMSYFSKRVLPEPIGKTSALPALFMVAYEYVRHRYPESRAATAWYWVVAILVATALIIALHA